MSPEIPCSGCIKPCESPYNDDGECWGPEYPIKPQGIDWQAYEKLYYRERNELPPGKRENVTGTNG